MIKHIDIINLSHYDIGFTDHPCVGRALQVRFLDQALDLAAASCSAGPGRGFHWTVESNNALLEWWQAASASRRTLFTELAHAGQIEVGAMPFSNGPTMDARQFRCCARWLPADIRNALPPMRTVLQNDVNGIPRAGIMALLDEGVEFLWMGLNRDTGGSPVPQPSAFWWRMPDGRRMFAWNAPTYPNGYFLFEHDEWRRGPLPTAADTRYRAPERGDILEPSPENLQRAHACCLATLQQWQNEGYAHNRVAVSMTNMWRIDNDPPCGLLPDFVAAWNAAGLTPTLSFTTPAKALTALREVADKAIPTMEGEWTSWWANGVASTPRAAAATRRAKRLLNALDSPLYPKTPERDLVMENCARQLCFFDEHTWGSWNSAARPDSPDSIGQLADKVGWAYRPNALAELAVGDANRALISRKPGIHVVNPYPEPFTGWITLTDDCLRGQFDGVVDSATGEELAFDRLPGVNAFFTVPTEASQFSPMDVAKVFPDQIAGKTLRLWIERLAPHSVRTFLPRKQVAGSKCTSRPEIVTDPLGWPVSASWNGRRLFRESPGDLFCREFKGLAPRWTYKRILDIPDATQRQAERDANSSLTQALATTPASFRDSGPTLIYEQFLAHRRLGLMRRRLEIQKQNPCARLEIVMDRLSSPESAEIFYIRIPVPAPAAETRLDLSGIPFRPGIDQMPRTCRDYYAIDGRVVYDEGEERTVAMCYDTPLVAMAGMDDGLRRSQLPQAWEALYPILYNNVWYTNWPGDKTGQMEFTFDLFRLARTEPESAPEAFAVVNLKNT